MKNVIKNISYTVISNIMSFVVSAFITIIAPKILGVESYAYLQLYFFYVTYTGFLHFGWADGIFLRYAGIYASKVDNARISGQFWMYSIIEVLIGILVAVIGYEVVSTPDKSTIMILLGVSAILTLPKTFLQYLLQCTNRIRDYALLVISERITYVSAVIIFIVAGWHSYQIIILADLLGKMVALLWAIYKCKDIVFVKPMGFFPTAKEAMVNISIGIKLMISNIASMLIVGVVRISIEKQWSVETFGKVSLTIAISNLLMVFIGAVSLVMFPLLRRTNVDRLPKIYLTMRVCLMIPLLAMLMLYYPAKIVLSAWLPQYAESLKYMALLFPMCVFESKMSVLISTYMKTLRLEKTLLFVNFSTLLLSLIITGVTVFWLHNLDLAIASIVVLIAFRCVFAELLVARSIDINVKGDIFSEIILTIIFIYSSWVFGGIKGVAIYAFFFIGYLVLQRRKISEAVKSVRTNSL